MSIENAKLMNLVKSLTPEADNVTIERIAEKIKHDNKSSIGLIIKKELSKQVH